ncbi:hypothetical protein [Pseudodesulfovibrio sediminis]|uniref:Uncharacterized protein n=1 Tax=Pseudodesulfovibrio sediminis TaxID=2810563 RepID=A0ABM7P231_9BACT|nr:hypothetical protein [Pseudodesulfovibrio sediminis]BCS86832.1 hypothetical protein PSDVSF_00740 [Pseudodesulfovibrio sediminis]
MGTILIPTQTLPPNSLGPEVTLVDFFHWNHVLEEWEGLLEKDLIQMVQSLELPAYRYKECRKRPDGKLVVKACLLQPYSIWRYRPIEEQEDSFIDPNIDSSPPQDYVIRRDFKDVFRASDVVFRSQDLAILEANHPDWKWPHVDPSDEEVLEEKKDRRPLVEVGSELVAGKTPDMVKIELRERYDEPIVAYVLHQHFSTKGSGRKISKARLGELMWPDEELSDSAFIKKFNQLLEQAEGYKVRIS